MHAIAAACSPFLEGGDGAAIRFMGLQAVVDAGAGVGI